MASLAELWKKYDFEPLEIHKYRYVKLKSKFKSDDSIVLLTILVWNQLVVSKLPTDLKKFIFQSKKRFAKEVGRFDSWFRRKRSYYLLSYNSTLLPNRDRCDRCHRLINLHTSFDCKCSARNFDLSI